MKAQRGQDAAARGAASDARRRAAGANSHCGPPPLVHGRPCSGLAVHPPSPADHGRPGAAPRIRHAESKACEKPAVDVAYTGPVVAVPKRLGVVVDYGAHSAPRVQPGGKICAVKPDGEGDCDPARVFRVPLLFDCALCHAKAGGAR